VALVTHFFVYSIYLTYILFIFVPNFISMTNITWEDYLHLFEQILSGESDNEIYNKPDYLEFIKLNQSRMNRWLKTGKIHPEVHQAIHNISAPQTWYLITEPWCGDAAHSVPFIYLMAQENKYIDLRIVLRDDNHEFIDAYLTNGGRSIPKLVSRNENDEDLFVWGPRPKDSAVIHAALKAKNADFDTINQALQQWYNSNKGVDVQNEIAEILTHQLV
jgi:hypothetical protein